MITVKEAADMVGISRQRLHHYIGRGKLEAHQVGRILILDSDDVEAFIAARQEDGTDEEIRGVDSTQQIA